MRVVATSAAHQVTAVGLLCCFIADPALSAHTACHWVWLTVIGRLINVHQVSVHGLAVRVRLFDLQECGPFIPAGSNWLHMHGLVVLILEDVAKLTELGERCPARLGCA